MESTETVDEFLEHYGTKGMKWGVRRNIQSRSGASRSEWVDAKDAKWVGKVNANPKISKVARIAARDAKKQTKRLKKDYKDRGLNIKKNSLDRTRYDNELKNILQHSVERASHKVHGSSPTGLKEVHIHRHPDGSLSATIGTRDNPKIRKQQRRIAKADKKAVKHADVEMPTAEDFDGLEFLFVLDDEGFVDDILTPFDDEDELEQSDMDDENDDSLMHYGVKGMRWGVRRSSGGASSGSSGSSSIKPKAGSSKPPWQSPPPKKVAPVAPKVKKGRFGRAKPQPKVLSEDAQQFRDLRLKVKKHGVESLTNKDLEVINKRLELQAKYNKAYPKKKNPLIELAIDGVLSEQGSKSIVEVVKKKSPKMAPVVEAAILINRTTRNSKKKG